GSPDFDRTEPARSSASGTPACRVGAFWPLWTPGTQMFGCPRNRGNFSLPDVRGRWEGWTRDQLNPDVPRRIAIECRQSAWRVNVTSWSETGSITRGICGIFFEEAPGFPTLMNFGI